MNEKNLKFLSEQSLEKDYELKILLEYVLSRDENLIAIIENLLEAQSIIPSLGRIKKGNIYILTNKKIILLSLDENKEIIDSISINQILKTSIERILNNNEREYESIKKVIGIRIDFKNKNNNPIIFIFDSLKANNLIDFQKFQSDAVNFIKKLNELL